MGWSGGTELAEHMIDLCAEYVPQINHKPFLTACFQVLESMDWDTQPDLMRERGVLDKTVKSVLKQMHPELYEDEENEVKYDA